MVTGSAHSVVDLGSRLAQLHFTLLVGFYALGCRVVHDDIAVDVGATYDVIRVLPDLRVRNQICVVQDLAPADLVR